MAGNDKKGIINTINTYSVCFYPGGIQPLTAPYRRRYGAVLKSCTCWNHVFTVHNPFCTINKPFCTINKPFCTLNIPFCTINKTVLHYKAACACFRMTSRRPFCHRLAHFSIMIKPFYVKVLTFYRRKQTH